MSREQKREAWRIHINAHRKSGLTQRAYCSEHGLSKSQFSYWKSQLDHPADTGRFVPLTVQAREAVVTLNLPGGIRMAIPEASLESALPTVLRSVAKVVG